LASISDKSIPIKFSFDTIKYGLPSNGDIYIITNKGKEFLNSYTDSLVNVNFSLQPKGLCIIEISPTI